MMPLMIIWKAKKSRKQINKQLKTGIKKGQHKRHLPITIFDDFGNKNTDHRRMNDGLCFFLHNYFSESKRATATIL